MAATIPVGEIVLWGVRTAAVAAAGLGDAGVNLATPATWTGTANREFYRVGSTHIGVVGDVQNPGGAGGAETCHVIFGLCAGNTVAARAAAAAGILAGGADAANRAIVTHIPVVELSKEMEVNKTVFGKVVFGGSRKKRQSKKKKNQRKHNNNQ